MVDLHLRSEGLDDAAVMTALARGLASESRLRVLPMEHPDTYTAARDAIAAFMSSVKLSVSALEGAASSAQESIQSVQRAAADLDSALAHGVFPARREA